MPSEEDETVQKLRQAIENQEAADRLLFMRVTDLPPVLAYIEQLEAKRWQMNDEIIIAVDAYIDEEIKRKAAEQQLTQAREENALLKDHTQDNYWSRYYKNLWESAKKNTLEVVEERDVLRAENAAMRALLERVFAFDDYSGYYIGEELQREIRAFLADHPQN